MLLEISYPYTGGFLCCPYKLGQFTSLMMVFYKKIPCLFLIFIVHASFQHNCFRITSADGKRHGVSSFLHQFLLFFRDYRDKFRKCAIFCLYLPNLGGVAVCI